MKYVIVRIEGSTNINLPDGEYPILFPDVLTHKVIGDHVKHAAQREANSPDVTLAAAGFITEFGGHATGYSESLHLNARPEDTPLIQKNFPFVGRRP